MLAPGAAVGRGGAVDWKGPGAAVEGKGFGPGVGSTNVVCSSIARAGAVGLVKALYGCCVTGSAEMVGAETEASASCCHC